MAEIRYSLVIDGSQTAGDYTNPDPTTASGNVTVATLGSVARLQVPVGASATVDLNTVLQRGGAATVEFVAMTSTAAFFVSKEGTVNEEWEVAAGGWFLVHTQQTTDDIKIRNATGSVITVQLWIGGQVA